MSASDIAKEVEGYILISFNFNQKLDRSEWKKNFCAEYMKYHGMR